MNTQRDMYEACPSLAQQPMMMIASWDAHFPMSPMAPSKCISEIATSPYMSFSTDNPVGNRTMGLFEGTAYVVGPANQWNLVEVRPSPPVYSELDDSSIKEKRRKQNRLAQRAHRERKSNIVKSQEKQIMALKMQLEDAKAQILVLKQLVISTTQGEQVPLSSDLPYFSKPANDDVERILP